MTDQSTTKILAIGTFAPGTDMQLVQRTLAAEVRATAELYLQGKIDQWYALENRPGVVFILNVTGWPRCSPVDQQNGPGARCNLFGSRSTKSSPSAWTPLGR